MNQVFQAAAESASGGLLMGVLTGVFLVFFAGWAVWAFWPGNKEQMERHARMPLEED